MNYPNNKYKVPVSIASDSQIEDINLWYFPLYSFWDKIKFYFQGKKLIKSWENIFNIKIYDPDGWDRTDPYLFDRYYTKDEFKTASCYSTCEFGVDSVNFIYNDTWDLTLQGVKERWDVLLLVFQYTEELHKIIEETNKTFSFQRGHKIVFFEIIWLYDDNYSSAKIERPCIKCGKISTSEGYDACLGHIDGVKHACCGHGISVWGIDQSYAVKDDGTEIRPFK